MKQFYLSAFFHVISLLFCSGAFAQTDHITLFLQNDSVINSTTIQFELYAVSDGIAGSDLRANSFQFGVNFNKDILAAGATVTASYVTSTSDFIPPLNGFVFPVASFPDHVRIVQSAYVAGNTGITMVLGQPYRVGTFRLVSSQSWVAGKTADLCLQDSVIAGKTMCGAIVWVGNTQNLSTVPTTVSGGCSHCNFSVRMDSRRESCPGALDGIVTATPLTGTPPYSFLWTNGATTSAITSLSTGVYSIMVSDFNGCLGVGVARILDSVPFCNYNIMKGYCFLDYNFNNIKDFGEPGYNKLLVVSKGTSNTYSSVPDAQGAFINFLPDTGLNITSLQNLSPPFTYYTITPLKDSSVFTTYFNTDSVAFALAPKPGISDLQLSMIAVTPERIGRDVTYRLIYSNVGTNIMSGTINMVKDSRLMLLSSIPTYNSANGDSISWSYVNLLPNEKRTIDVLFHVPSPPTVNVGDMLNSHAVIEPVATDTTPNDNYSALNERAVGSYDPNDKTMLWGDYFTTIQVASGQYFNYLIRFQNTGTDTAFYVNIRDTLDNKLDAASFEMIDASHPYMVSIMNEKYISWTFENIILTDSNHNEPASHGYVCFRIKPGNTVTAGDMINNTAHIFFDFNLPVATNTAVTSITFPTATGSLEASLSKVLLFPNPSSKEIMISGFSPTKKTSIEIYNMPGVKVYESLIESNKSVIDVSSFQKGVYAVVIQNEGERVVTMFVKN